MNRSELVKTLELVRPAVSDSDLVPIFTHYVFEGGEVYGYNDAIGIIAKCDVGQTFAVQGKLLLDLLKSLSAEEVTFTQGDNDIKIKAGKSLLNLPWLPKEDFVFEVPDTPTSATIKAGEDLVTGIETCLLTASTDQTAPAIMGVTFNFGKELTLYSCDGDAITRYRVDAKPKGSGVYMAPTPFCDAVVKVWKETGPSDFTISFNKDWAFAEFKNWNINIYGSMKEIDTPLDHAKLIKETMTGKQKPVPVPLNMVEALGRARVIADLSSAVTEVTIDDSGCLKLLTQGTGTGECTDTLTIRGHDPVRCHVHASLIERCYRVCDHTTFQEAYSAHSTGGKILVICSNVND